MLSRFSIGSCLLIKILALTIACGSGTGASDDNASHAPANTSESIQYGTGVVGPEGGEVHSLGGELRLRFAEDTFDDQTPISIESRPGDHNDLISELYELQPSGMTFDPPVSVTLMVEGLHAYTTNTVALARFDSGSAEILEQSHHWGEGVDVELTRFSSYGAVSLESLRGGTSPELSERCEEVSVGGRPCTGDDAAEVCTNFPDLPGTSEASFDSSIDFVPDYLCVCEQGDVSFGTMRTCWAGECQGPEPPCTQACEDQDMGEWTGDCYHPTVEEYRAARR